MLARRKRQKAAALQAVMGGTVPAQAHGEPPAIG